MRIKEMKVRWNKAQISILSIAATMFLAIFIADILDFRAGYFVLFIIVVVLALGLYLFRDKKTSN